MYGPVSFEMVSFSSEHPGFNGIGSARSLAKLAAVMAKKGRPLKAGRNHGQTLMSEEAWEKMHAGEKLNADHEIGGFRTLFTQGGVNHFIKGEDDIQAEKWFNYSHLGCYGWKGLGGSMMMWNPEHEIGFSYVPATMVWYTQGLGAHIQSVFTECFNKLNDIHSTDSDSSRVTRTDNPEKLLTMSDVVEAAMDAQKVKAKGLVDTGPNGNLKTSAQQVITKVLTNVSGEVIRHG